MGMTEIKIHYRPIPRIAWNRQLICRFPVAWVELSSPQLITASGILHGTVSDNAVIRSMLGVPGKVARRLSSFQKYSLISLMAFLNRYEAQDTFIIPSIGGLTSPLPRLKDEPFAAFLFAEHYFEAYLKSPDPMDLARFVACWYRKGAFSEKQVEANALELIKTNPETLRAVALNYHLIREWLAGAYPAVFEVSDRKQTDTPETSWLDVLDAIVGEDIVHHDDYATLPVNTVLRFLNTRIKESCKHGKR